MAAAGTLLQAAPSPDPRPDLTALRARMRFLSSDPLEGRGAGTRGYDVAAAWVASAFEALGLEPGAADGSWFQPVPLLHATVTAGALTIGATKVAHGAEVLVFAPPATETHLRGQVVLAGHGIDAPELGIRDYDGLDVRGRLVAVLAGAPAALDPDERAYFGDQGVKTEAARAHGASGVLLLRAPAQESAWPRYVRQSEAGTYYSVDDDGTPHAWSALPLAILNRPAADLLLAASGRRLADVSASPTAARGVLPGEVAFDARVTLDRVESRNVVARLPGVDSRLAGEHVLFTAHADHLGVGTPVDGDRINHGAIDNAGGVAAVLEIARMIRDAPVRPARSLLFAIVTAEEKGMLGSAYLAAHPPAPTIVADVNLDNFLPLYPLRDVEGIGAAHSSLDRDVREAAAQTGLDVVAAPRPGPSPFARNDEISFVDRGIPAVTIGNGSGSTDPAVDVNKLYARWFATIYHTPRDNMRQPFDWHAMEQYVALNYRIGMQLATDPERPRWRDDDFFGRRFGGAR